MITFDNVMEALATAVSTRGPDYGLRSDLDRNGPGCLYWENSAPGCLIGVALAQDGAGPDDLHCLDQGDLTSIDKQWELGHPVARRHIEDEETAEVLSIAQYIQDNGGSWGGALVAAQMCWDRKNATEHQPEAAPASEAA